MWRGRTRYISFLSLFVLIAMLAFNLHSPLDYSGPSDMENLGAPSEVDRDKVENWFEIEEENEGITPGNLRDKDVDQLDRAMTIDGILSPEDQQTIEQAPETPEQEKEQRVVVVDEKKTENTKPKKEQREAGDVYDEQDNPESSIAVQKLLVLVMSERSHHAERQHMRESMTFSTNSQSVCILRFLVENGAESLEVADDIVVTNSKSSSEKLLEGMKWTASNNPKANYIAVIQEKTVFWPARILHFASTASARDYFVIGNIIHMMPRDKAKDPHWNPGEFPAFPDGKSGFVLTMPVVQYLANEASSLLHFHRADVSLGVWLDGLRVKWVHNGDSFRTDGKCLKDAMIVHGKFTSTDSMFSCKVQGKLSQHQLQDHASHLSFFSSLFSSLTKENTRRNEDIHDERLVLDNKFVIPPDTSATGRQKAEIVILVLSARGYVERRKMVREIMVYEGAIPANVIVKFIVGEGDSNLEDEDDIIVMPIKDHYSKLPSKLKYGYSWVATCHPEAQFVVKVDDDVVFWPGRIASYLQKVSSTEMIVLGGVKLDIDTKRDGKWAEHWRWEPTFYPAFPLGSFGHIVSRPVYMYIAKYAPVLYEFQGEDSCLAIWMTGLKCNFKNAEDVMANSKRCGGKPFLVVGHDFVTKRSMQMCKMQSRTYRNRG